MNQKRPKTGAGEFGQRYVNPKVGRAKTQKTVELRYRAKANPKDGRAKTQKTVEQKPKRR